MKNLPNILLFGAGNGAENYILKQQDYNILAILDNNINKTNQLFKGYKIFLPSSMYQFNYDLIVIASMFYSEIFNQLIELGVSESKIIAAPKAMLKKSNFPFEDLNTLNFAEEIFLKIVNFFKELKIRYFIDFGTLLGLIRDGEFIKWDDDIDFSIHEDDVKKLIDHLPVLIKGLSEDVMWSFRVLENYNRKKTSIVLDFEGNEQEKLKNFSIDIWIIYFADGFANQVMNQCHEKYFRNSETIKFKNNFINVPYQYEDYLQYTYGDWKIPNKNFNFSFYKHAFKTN